MSHVVSLSNTVSLFLTHQQVRQLEEESQQLQQQLDQSLEMSQQAIQAANRRAEVAQQRIREIEIEKDDLHRQVQQLQDQVSSVVFHHTCTVCGVCSWLLLCPHTHSWQERSIPTGW